MEIKSVGIFRDHSLYGTQNFCCFIGIFNAINENLVQYAMK